MSPSVTVNLLDILNGVSSFGVLCAQDFHDISKDGDQLCLGVLKLIENWSAGYVRLNYDQYTSVKQGKHLTTEELLEIVRILKCEDEFCQIFLLLPEKTKGKLIHELSDVFNRNMYPELRTIFIHQSSTNYSKNVMCKIHRLHISVIQCFFGNIMEIVKCNLDIINENAIIVLNFLDNFLGRDENGGHFHVDAFTILNKSGEEEVQSVIDSCKSCSGGTPKKHVDIKHDLINLLACETYSSIMIRLFDILNSFEKGSQVIDEQLTDLLLCRITSKASRFVDVLTSEEITCTHKEELMASINTFLTTRSSNTSVCDIADGISRLGINDNNGNNVNNGNMKDSKCSRGVRSKDNLLSRWRAEKKKKEKFVLALQCLDNLWFGFEEALSWLLSYEDMDEDERRQLVEHLTAYTINYGSTNFVKRSIDMLLEEEKVNSTPNIANSLKQVILKCLPYLALKSCNALISSRRSRYHDDSLLLCSTYTKETFESALNEVLNKLTSSRSDSAVCEKLAQFSVVSPFSVLKLLIDRIFLGTLNLSVLKNVLSHIPAYFVLELTGDTEDPCFRVHNIPIFTYLKDAYVKNKNKPTSKNLKSFITIILDTVPNTSRRVFYYAAYDLFIIPNLTLSGDDLPSDIGLTLDVTTALLQHPYIEFTTAIYDVTLCEIMFCILDSRKKISVGIMDSIHNLVHVFILDLSEKFMDLVMNDQERVLVAITKLLKKHSWDIGFYFYSFFISVGYLYKYTVPNSLLILCECFDTSKYIPQFDPAIFNKVHSADQHVDKWIGLFQLSCASFNAASAFIDEMPVLIADEEVSNIVESVSQMIPGHASTNKAQSIMKCLKYIVDNEKMGGVASWLRHDLSTHSSHHGICLSTLVFIQGFEMYYSELTEDVKYKKRHDLQNYLKIFNLFLLYAKGVENIEIRASILLYLFEQLLFNTTLLGEVVTNMLLLLLMDILAAILDCDKLLVKDVADRLVEECRDIIHRDECGYNVTLREKFNSYLNSC